MPSSCCGFKSTNFIFSQYTKNELVVSERGSVMENANLTDSLFEITIQMES
jgi:hypothetical protein